MYDVFRTHGIMSEAKMATCSSVAFYICSSCSNTVLVFYCISNLHQYPSALEAV